MASEIVKKAAEHFEQIKKGNDQFTSIPDAGLQQKIKKVGEAAQTVIEHIKTRTDPTKQG